MVKRTTKKKSRRVDSRRIIEGENAARLQAFYDSGIPLWVVMLAVFVIISSALLLINSMNKAGEIVFWPGFGEFSITMAIMAFLSVALGLYVVAYEHKILHNYIRGTVLLIWLLIMIALLRFSINQNWSPYFLVVPLMITAISITIAYSQRFALGVSAFLGLICLIALAGSPDIESPYSFKEGLGFVLATGSGTGIAILSLREIRTRTKLIEVSAVAAIVVFAMIVVMGMWQGKDWNEMVSNGIWGGGGALGVGFVMQGLLPIVERVFGTATNMTLLDYSEATKPLLKRLAVEAPGTFNHSFQIGMLAEAAAEAIGANGLLCRVGSYYHDVGKINKPRFFVENQAERFNQHKELSPTMSRMIIIGHVKDGLELLREYKIPKVLHQFCATHHGTTLVEYFYHEATKRESESGRTVEQTEFRYPGPKPQTRESAIVMIADAVEGATRAMKDPTPSRIENVVHNMAMKRLQDGQFDECDLTMRDLHLIEDSLIKSLCGMYHGRIAYPKQDKLIKTGADSGASERALSGTSS